MATSEELLPNYKREYLSNQQLALSLVQVRFPALARLGDEKILTGIKAAMSDEYPLITQAAIMNMVITPQGVSQAPAGSAWQFSTINRQWVVQISETSVSLETRRYQEIEDFAERFTLLLRIVVEYLQPKYQLRLGLRYVNEFRHPGGKSHAGWRQLLNPELLGLNASELLGGAVEQTIGEVRTKRADGTVLLRHGFLNGTTVAPQEGQEPKTGPFYLLDMDYYDEDAKRFNVESVAAQIERYNDILYRVFRWIIGDSELYQFLRGDA